MFVNLSDKLVLIYEENTMDGNNIRQVLAKNIKSFREHRSWSQAELAESADISIPFLSEIERGNKWPYPDTLGKIANSLNVQVHELFLEKTIKIEHEYTAMVFNELQAAQKAATEKIIKKYLGKSQII